MATTAPTTGRFFPVPDLVGVKASEAIQRLRELGLTPVPLPSAVADVAEAGFVLGLDPPPESPVRSRAKITLSVGTHPDFDGRVEEPSAPVQPPLAWPHSADPGLVAPLRQAAPSELRAPQSAAKPGVTSAPASSSDAAFGEFPREAGSSRTDTQTSGAAADPYMDDLSQAVPTPADYAAQDAWDRLRASESARFADTHTVGAETAEPEADEPPVVTAEIVDLRAERDAEDRARREARKRSARRYRRMSVKQRLVLGGLFSLIVLLIIAAATNHKPKLKGSERGAATTTTAKTSPTRVPPRAHAPAHVKRVPKHKSVPKKRKAHPRRRVIVIHRTRTKVVTVTVATPTTAPTSAPTSVASTYTPPPRTTTRTATTYTHSSTQSTPAYHAPAASSPKPASTHASADKTSSRTGGGSTLQTPNGATAPPTPYQP